MKVTSVSGVKVYDLSQGANSLPEFLDTKVRKRISKDPEYARRIELLQDFHFPAYSRTVRVSRDGRYILASGGYKPHIKLFDVAEVSMKFDRFVDADIIRADFLSDDFQKLSMLCEDRTLLFHSKFGTHHTVRLPFMGRDVSIDRETCDMYIATNRRTILRFNLMEGRFRQSWETSQDLDELSPEHQGNNAVVWNKYNRLVAAAGQDGCVRIWDPRQRTECGKLDQASPDGACTAIQFDTTSDSSLSFVMGDSKGMCRVFDLRSARPLLEKEHPYGSPIKSIQFRKVSNGIDVGMDGGSTSSGSVVVTNDSKQVKGWNLTSGSTLFNIESSFPMDEIYIAPLNKLEGDSSGLIFATGQAERIGTFFVPSLGPAPIWASFLESLTEELEEKDFSVYEDYRFVTKEELEDLNLGGLIGSDQLRPWMHGYFIETKTFEKFKAAMAKPLEKGELRRLRQQEKTKKIETTKSQKIVLTKKIKINPDLAERNEVIVNDDRFADLFENPAFQVDTESREYKQMYSSGMKTDGKKQQMKRARDDDSDNDDIRNNNDDLEYSDDEEEEEGDERPQVKKTTQKRETNPPPQSLAKPKQQQQQVAAKLMMRKGKVMVKSNPSQSSSFLDEPEDTDTPTVGKGVNDQEHVLRTKTPVYKRLLNAKKQEEDTVVAQTSDPTTGEMSITFIPKSDLRKMKNKKRNAEDANDDE